MKIRFSASFVGLL